MSSVLKVNATAWKRGKGEGGGFEHLEISNQAYNHNLRKTTHTTKYVIGFFGGIWDIGYGTKEEE